MDEKHMIAVKVEPFSEDGEMVDLEMKQSQLHFDLNFDTIKNEDIEIKVENLSEELDIGPWILQPKTMACSNLTPATLTAAVTSADATPVCHRSVLPFQQSSSPMCFKDTYDVATTTRPQIRVDCKMDGSDSAEDDKYIGANKDLKSYASLSESENSMSFSKKGSKYECDYCNYRTNTKSSLRTHIRSHISKKSFVCKLCGRILSCRYTLKIHMDMHKGVKVTCEKCGICCSDLSNLMRHMRTHNGQRSYKCKQCGYSSFLKANLIVHLRTHTGEKPFGCEQCGYRSSDKSTLNRHMGIHENRKLHKCELCGYSTSRKYQLTAHMRVHTGEKPYACDCCKYKTADKCSIRKHMLNHKKAKAH